MFLGDYHTHTRFSHGKGSVNDNVAEAVRKGLKEIAITDHGLNHITFGVKRKKLQSYLDEIQKAGETFCDIKVYKGVEANLLNNKGDVDLSSEQAAVMDIIILGYHKFVRTSLSSVFSFSTPVFMSGLINKSSKKRKIQNTEAFIKAMEKYKISIISHPGLGIDIDFIQLATAAAYYDVFLELNGKQVVIPKDKIEGMLDTGVRFIVNSDAHSPNRVGDMAIPEQYINSLNLNLCPQKDQSYNYLLQSVVNYNNVPCFRKKS